MVDPDRLTHSDMLRTAPLQSAMFTVVPMALGGLQLANSLVNGLSLAISVPFALGMLAFAAVLTRYRFARFRRRHADEAVSIGGSDPDAESSTR